MPRGSKPGERRGGRTQGTPNKTTQRRRAIAKKALESGLTPLDYMLDRLRDANEDSKVRQQMARDAAPYVHPRLAAIEHSGPDKKPIQHEVNITPEEAYLQILHPAKQ